MSGPSRIVDSSGNLIDTPLDDAISPAKFASSLESASEGTRRILTGTYMEAQRYNQSIHVKEVGEGRAKIVMTRKGKNGKNYLGVAIVSPTFITYKDGQDNEVKREVLIVEHGDFGATSLATSSADLYALLMIVASGIAQQDPYYTLGTNEEGTEPADREIGLHPKDYNKDGSIDVDRVVDREMKDGTRLEEDTKESEAC